ncbi:tetratricopeptide repeat protein [Derxia lacustris]|uniref:tetratricopeptide repeat protein n=1 Tax=Derxia lacustris TaxID=764842 RepID=UPI001594AEC4|nr:tetratricopeptide repeat protein [Derxia lacustris]
MTALPATAAASRVALAQASDDAKPPAAAVAAARRVLPDERFDAPSMYQIIMAEIALQRGEVAAGYATYLSVARSTGDARLAKRAVEIALARRDVDAMLEATRLWSQIAPEDRDAQTALRGLLVESGRIAEAEPLLKTWLAGLAHPELAFAELQQQASIGSDKAATLQVLDRLGQPYLNQPQVRLALARAAFGAGQRDRALVEARAALKLDPNNELAVLTTAELLSAGDPGAAIGLLRDHAKAHPDALEVRLAYARALAQSGDVDATRAVVKPLLDKSAPPRLIAAAAGIAYQIKDFDLAQTGFERAIAAARAVPNNGGLDVDAVRFGLAQLYEDRHDYKRAAEVLRGVQGARAFTAQMRVALLTARDGRIDDARRVLHDLPARDDSEAMQITLTEAQILRDGKDSQGSFRVLSEALAKSPDAPELLYDYALAADKVGKPAEMERALRRVIELRPGEAQGYNALGYSLADRNERLDEAGRLIDRALELAPDDPFIMDSKGWVLYRQGWLDESIATLQRAYQLRGDPEIAAHLGEVLWVAGKRDAAQQAWRAARAQDPANETLVETLARLNVRF